MTPEQQALIEKVAEAICEASGGEWHTGTHSVYSGPNFELEEHDRDSLNNGWRFIAKAAIAVVIEEAARVANSLPTEYDNDGASMHVENITCARCAAAIRALKKTEHD